MQTAILVLNHHQPEATLTCMKSLLASEGPHARVLWIESDADNTLSGVVAQLEESGLPWKLLDPASDPLPPAGVVGLLPVPGNRGYGGGNNIGLRFVHRHGIPYAWVLNNDTELLEGSSADLMAAAEAHPEVGLWGTRITQAGEGTYVGGCIRTRDFGAEYIRDLEPLETSPHTFISGCSMFFRVALAAEVGFIPEDYFLYFEDVAFTWEIRGKGLKIRSEPKVNILHSGSLATGFLSPLMEYYLRRNRWVFIRRYFPGHLRRQILRFLFYQNQKLFFRFRMGHLRLEWLAFRDFCRGRMNQALEHHSGGRS